MNSLDKYTEDLINANSFQDIKAIILDIIKSTDSPEKYINTTVYRKYISGVITINEFKSLQRLTDRETIENSKKLKNFKIHRHKKFKGNYEHSNVINPFQGGGCSPK